MRKGSDPCCAAEDLSRNCLASVAFSQRFEQKKKLSREKLLKYFRNCPQSLNITLAHFHPLPFRHPQLHSWKRKSLRGKHFRDVSLPIGLQLFFPPAKRSTRGKLFAYFAFTTTLTIFLSPSDDVDVHVSVKVSRVFFFLRFNS